jgi:hypothetical protein
MEDGKMGNATTIRAVLAILQWWGFNVTVIIINKWIFQVGQYSLLLPFPFLVNIDRSIHSFNLVVYFFLKNLN